jgi:folate-binding protein YgfZ
MPLPLIRDLSERGRFELRGSDRVRFLHGMVTNDIERLLPGQGCHAALLTVKGKLLGDLVIYADAEVLTLELEGAVRDKIRGVLEKHMIVDDVELIDVTDATHETGIYGEDAAGAIAARLGVDVGALAPYHHAVTSSGVRVARNPWLGISGYHVIGSAAWDGPGERLDEPAAEVLRVEAGTPRYGVDMDEDRLILEANLADAVSFDKGCYLGQEVVARATARGHINRKLVGLVIGDGMEPVARGARVSAKDRDDAGLVTSSVISPRLDRPVALGYLHRTLWEPGTEVAVHDGDRVRRATVSTLPF